MLKLTLLIVGSLWLLWGYYLSIMHLKTARNQGKLTTGAKIFGYPHLLVFLILDVLVNVIVGSILFLEPPRELTLSSRLSRLNDRDDWKGTLARFLCHQFLDSYDPAGRHCK